MNLVCFKRFKINLPLTHDNTDKTYLKVLKQFKQYENINYIRIILKDYHFLSFNPNNADVVNPLKLLFNGTISFDTISNDTLPTYANSFSDNAIDHNELCNICMNNTRNVELSC